MGRVYIPSPSFAVVAAILNIVLWVVAFFLFWDVMALAGWVQGVSDSSTLFHQVVARTFYATHGFFFSLGLSTQFSAVLAFIVDYGLLSIGAAAILALSAGWQTRAKA